MQASSKCISLRRRYNFLTLKCLSVDHVPDLNAARGWKEPLLHMETSDIAISENYMFIACKLGQLECFQQSSLVNYLTVLAIAIL